MSALAPNSKERRWCTIHSRLEAPPWNPQCFPVNEQQVIKDAVRRLASGVSTIIFPDGPLELTDLTLKEYRPTINDEMAKQGWIRNNLSR